MTERKLWVREELVNGEWQPSLCVHFSEQDMLEFCKIWGIEGDSRIRLYVPAEEEEKP